jgi:hypothetical protein
MTDPTGRPRTPPSFPIPGRSVSMQDLWGRPPTPPGPQKTSPALARPQPRRGRLVAVLASVMVALWMTAAAVWYARRSSESLAEALLGRWETTDPRYAGRAIDLSDSTLGLQVGSAQASLHRIRRVRRSSQNDEVRYEIRYADQGGSQRLVLYWSPLSGTLRLENPAEVTWHRAAVRARTRGE